MALSQAAYRFGINESTESGHGFHAAQNTDIDFAPGVSFLLRFLCQASGGVAHNNIDWQFQCSKNGGAFQNITTSSTIARAVTVAVFTEAANCTNRLTGGTGTFESSAAGCTLDGVSGGNNCDIVSNGFTETECALQIMDADVINGDKIQFRLLQEGAVMDTYAVTPTLTVVSPKFPRISMAR